MAASSRRVARPKRAAQPQRASKSRPSAKRPPKEQEPSTVRDKIFCDRWLVHRDHNRAAMEAGFSQNTGDTKQHPLRRLSKFRPYLDRMLAKVERSLAKELVYERKDILDHLAAIGMANPQDYFEEFEQVYTDPKTNFETTYRVVALKPLSRLTPLQASAVENVQYHPNSGRITYELPSVAVKARTLGILGENTGDLRKHNPDQTPRHVHFHNVPFEQLESLAASFQQVLGPKVARELIGFDPTEDDDAQG